MAYKRQTTVLVVNHTDKAELNNLLSCGWRILNTVAAEQIGFLVILEKDAD